MREIIHLCYGDNHMIQTKDSVVGVHDDKLILRKELSNRINDDSGQALLLCFSLRGGTRFSNFVGRTYSYCA